jgi:hypothetical protein
MPRRDLLPGDGSIEAIRTEHRIFRVKLADADLRLTVNHPCFNRIEKLLAEIDRLEDELEDLMTRQRSYWRGEEE